tara:strand:+ start:332 stop:1135 length:804 start_codon:yes stop_codon:yes gene_type:complete
MEEKQIKINWKFIKDVGVFKWFFRTAIRQFYKRILRRGLWILLPNGLPYYCPPNDQAASEAYVTNGLVDWGAELKMLDFLNPNLVAIDIGARTGLYSLMMGKNVSQVIAFEPDPVPFQQLESYAKKYPWLKPINAAVSNFSGSTTLKIGANGFTHIGDRMGKTQVITIDEISKPYVVGFIKIDIDTFDLDAIEGAYETIKRDKPVILTELDSHETERLYSICADLGYNVSGYFKRKNRKPFWVENISRQELDMIEYKMLFLKPKQAD